MLAFVLAAAISPTAFWEAQWRSVGPIQTGGKVNDLAVPTPRTGERWRAGKIIYVAGPGGVFRTTDGGTHWTPIFDRVAKFSGVWTITTAPSRSSDIWVGTGEPYPWETPIRGDGVWVSHDGGDHWTYSGLRHDEYVGAIAADPADPQTVYAGTIGSFSHASNDRGLYKTTDGGKTWKKILFVNGWTGFVSIAIDPQHPDTIYAASEQQYAGKQAYVDFGPGSGFYKSTNGGATWRQMKDGLPDGFYGRSGLAVSASSPNKIYAVVDDATPNRHTLTPKRNERLYLSDDYGEHWHTGAKVPEGSGFYYGRLAVDPGNPQNVQVTSPGIAISHDGGKTLKEFPNFAWRLAADTHAIWIDPGHGDHEIMGNDHGIWISEDGGTSWRHTQNLPTAKIISVAVDDVRPLYNIYASIVDSGPYVGPSSSRYGFSFGTAAREWHALRGGNENGPIVPSPDGRAAIVGGDAQMADQFERLDLKRRQVNSIGPITPLGGHAETRFLGGGQALLSRYSSSRVYVGTTSVYRSDDFGDHWTRLGGRLSQPATKPIDVFGFPVRTNTYLGTVWGGYATTVMTLGESARDPRAVYAGTRDGVLARFEPSNNAWVRIKTPPVVRSAQVTGIVDTGPRLIASFHRGDADDQHPYIFRSSDGGKSWHSMVSTLPENAGVWSLAYDRTGGVLYAGTDAGVFAFTGGRWTDLGTPRVRVTSLAFQSRAHDLVAGLWGRGNWVLDDVSALAAPISMPPVFMPSLRPALEYSPGGDWLYEERHEAWTPNLPYGEPITYRVAAAVTAPHLQIAHAGGAIVRTIKLDRIAGLHRIFWDLREETLWPGGPVGTLVGGGRYCASILWDGGSSPQRCFEVALDPLEGTTTAEAALLQKERNAAAQGQVRLHATVLRAQRLLTELAGEKRNANASRRKVLNALIVRIGSIVSRLTENILAFAHSDGGVPALDLVLATMRGRLDGIGVENDPDYGNLRPLAPANKVYLDQALDAVAAQELALNKIVAQFALSSAGRTHAQSRP